MTPQCPHQTRSRTFRTGGSEPPRIQDRLPLASLSSSSSWSTLESGKKIPCGVSLSLSLVTWKLLNGRPCAGHQQNIDAPHDVHCRVATHPIQGRPGRTETWTVTAGINSESATTRAILCALGPPKDRDKLEFIVHVQYTFQSFKLCVVNSYFQAAIVAPPLSSSWRNKGIIRVWHPSLGGCIWHFQILFRGQSMLYRHTGMLYGTC